MARWQSPRECLQGKGGGVTALAWELGGCVFGLVVKCWLPNQQHPIPQQQQHSVAVHAEASRSLGTCSLWASVSQPQRWLLHVPTAVGGPGRPSLGAAMPVLRAHLPSVCRRVQSLFHSVQLNVNNPHFLIMQGRITKARRQLTVGCLGMPSHAGRLARLTASWAVPPCAADFRFYACLLGLANGLLVSACMPGWRPCFALCAASPLLCIAPCAGTQTPDTIARLREETMLR